MNTMPQGRPFETLLGILKVLRNVAGPGLTPAKLAFWHRRAWKAIAKAEAILARAPDPR